MHAVSIPRRCPAYCCSSSPPPSGFSWSLTVAYLPQRLVALLQGLGGSTEIFMLGSIALLILVGVLLEGLPSLNVVAPLMLPIAGKLGLSELHYALVLIIAMGIGGFMPLAGVGFYVCCAIMRCDVERASRAMLPYLIVVLVGLLIVAFVPWFALVTAEVFWFSRITKIWEDAHDPKCGSQRLYSRPARQGPPA